VRPSRGFIALSCAAALAGCSHGSMVPVTAAPTPATSSSSGVGPLARSANPYTIAYRIGWTDPASHIYDIQIDVDKVSGDVVKLQLPVWSPGRYAPFFFARNVTEFTVTNGSAPVRWDRENGSLL